MSTRQQKSTLHLPKKVFRIGIVRACFNEECTARQLHEAQQLIETYAVSYDVFEVAGSFEIPQMLDALARTKKYSGFVALGCLIKGETTHFEVVTNSVSQGIMEVALTYHLPIGFGIITAQTKKQANMRTWIGADAAYAVLQSLSQQARL